jgi:hypothetical protein
VVAKGGSANLRGRILFVLNRMAHVRHFDRAIRLLADRGHEIVLASQEDDDRVSEILADHPSITAIRAPQRRGDTWAGPAKAVRRTRDYLRYLHPRYADALLLRRRAFTMMVGAISGREEEVDTEFGELLRGMNLAEQKRLDSILAKLETVIPPDPEVQAFVDAQRPDLVVLSPLVGVGFSQADFVKSARALGIASGLLVFSWDNLSNKGLIHEQPDHIWVWNETQRVEAANLHRYPIDRVVVTGAPRFDAFFEMQSRISREDFCSGIGLDPSRPIITYLCSSRFVAAAEREFVDRWIAALRRSPDPALAGCGIIVRPHPAGVKGWHVEPRTMVRWLTPERDKAAVSHPFDDPQAVVMNSVMQNADQVLWDTVYHSAAVVGLNTSAEIEAAIVGRPVYTLLDPQAEGQKGTLHFHYLLREQGGHVYFSDTFEAHCAQLSDALAGRYDREALASFLRTFVRPNGIDRPVSPLVADAIEAVAAAPGTPTTVSAGHAP